MSIAEKAVAWAVGIANDNAHGYDQTSRWGPDYDCSSLVISAWEAAGVPVKTSGATYTGNMRSVFLRCGFEDVTAEVALSIGAGLQAGDVLLNEKSHTALYIGLGKIVQASINEKGTVTGGQTGDQTGGEIAVRSYYNFPWDCVLRYRENTSGGGSEAAEGAGSAGAVHSSVAGLPMLTEGSRGGAVIGVQLLLIHKWGIGCGPDGADGDYGPNTAAAVREFQREEGLETDGVVGPLTWAALVG